MEEGRVEDEEERLLQRGEGGEGGGRRERGEWMTKCSES